MSVIVLGPNPLLRIGQQTIVIGKKSAPTVIIETRKYNKGGFTHPEWEFGPASEDTSHMPDLYIERG